MKNKIKRALAAGVVTAAAVVVPTAVAVPAEATWAPGWNNLWVRAACVSRYPNPADNVTHFYVWVPNSPQGNKLFDPPDSGLGTYTGYYHYDNVYKTVWGDTYLNYRVHCKFTGWRTGQIRWGGSLGSTHWVSIAA